MADNAGSDHESEMFSDNDSDTPESDDDFDPSEVFVYRGRGSIPRNVRRVEVDRSVKFIPYPLFKNCRQLEWVLFHEGLLRIGKYAFSYCSLLQSIQIPSTVTKIGEGAFAKCSNLAAVELHEGLKSIKDGAFYECTSLVEVQIPGSVNRIGRSAFHSCTNLTSIELRKGLRMIGRSAFSGCRLLGSVQMPSSVDKIGILAFDGCSSLSSVRLHEDLLKMKKFAFRGCPAESFRFIRLSERSEAISMDGQTASMFESRLNEITNAITRDHEDGEAADAIWEKCKESLARAHEFLTYLELKGAVPVLELALWKAKIEGQGEGGMREGCVNNEKGGQDVSDAGREKKRPKMMKNIGQDARLSREDCRVKCGAGIVIPEVLKFFTYSSSWPRMDDSDEENAD